MKRLLTIELINKIAPVASSLRTNLLAIQDTLIFHHELIAMGVRESQFIVK